MEMKEIPVTIIVSGKNSATTIRQCLESLAAQDWPVDEILVFDNDSSDGSQDIIREVAAKSNAPIRLIDGGPDGFLCSAYNRGAAMAKSEIVVLCHSDGMVPSSGELRKLVVPLVEDTSAVAAYPRILMPREVWNRFPFWQKFVFVRAVDATNHAVCAIFDAVRREAFLSVGGFNERRFKAGNGYGGEDSDFWRRIGTTGRRIYTEACAVHLHNFSPDFGWRSYMKTRKLMARTYGKIIRFQRGVYCLGDMAFFIRPCLALLPFVMGAASHLLFGRWISGVVCALAILCLFALLNGWKMFTAWKNWLDPRMALVVPCGVFMVYYESYWFFDGIFRKASDEEGGR
jgi:glycosyltransferase involved in cell wall biosynthesis